MSDTAIITGGGKRIGRAIALFLAQRGYDIALHYRSSRESAEETAKEIKNNGVHCRLFQCDLVNTVDAIGMFLDVFGVFPDCNLLINSASIFERGNLLETDTEMFDRHFNANLKTPVFLTKTFAQHCPKGQVINLLDTKISRTLTAYFVYTLTKKSLRDFTRMAAKELGPGIRVNGISPGLILPSKEMGNDEFERLGERVPLGMTGHPDHIVNAVGYLLDNNFVTGEVLFVDGGEHLK